MGKSQQPLVSVLSLSYNRKNNIKNLMEALFHQDYENYEILVIDNNSQDDTVKFLHQNYPSVRVIKCPENLGLVAYNFGFSNVRGKYILIIDDDGLPNSCDWISRSVSLFEEHPRLGALGYTIRMQDTGLLAYDSPNYVNVPDFDNLYPAAAYNGTGAAIRTEAIEELGYYPFYFYRSWCELYLCTRLVDNGWDVHYIPDIEVWHCRPSGSINRPVTYYGLRNYYWYIWTFYPWWQLISETFRYTGSRLLDMINGKIPVSIFLKAVTNAIINWKKYSSDRNPISIESLNSLRRRRDAGNDHGLVRRHRPFAMTYFDYLQ